MRRHGGRIQPSSFTGFRFSKTSKVSHIFERYFIKMRKHGGSDSTLGFAGFRFLETTKEHHPQNPKAEG
jgi:hypothetical protein